MKPLWLGPAVLAIVLGSTTAATAATRVCVSVEQKSWYRGAAAPPRARGASPRAARRRWRVRRAARRRRRVRRAPTRAATTGGRQGVRRRARDRSDALSETDARVRDHARARVRRRRGRLPAAAGRRALSARERLDGVRALRRPRGEGRSGAARRVRRAGAADRLRAPARSRSRPDDHARERAALGQRAESAHRRGERALHLRHGDGGAARRAADGAGADAARRQRAAHPDPGQRRGRLPAQAPFLGVRRLRAGRARHRADRDSRQRSGRSRRLLVQPFGGAALPALPRRARGSTRSTSAAARRSSWRSSTPSARSRSGPRPPTATRCWAAVSTSTCSSATSSCARAPSTSSVRSSSTCRPTCSRPRTTAAPSTATCPARWRRSGSSSSDVSAAVAAGAPALARARGRRWRWRLFRAPPRAQLRTCVEIETAPGPTGRARAPRQGRDRSPPHPPGGRPPTARRFSRSSCSTSAPTAASGSPAASARRCRTGSGSAPTGSLPRSSAW